MQTLKELIVALKMRLDVKYKEETWSDDHHRLVCRMRNIAYELEDCVIEDAVIGMKQWQFFQVRLLKALAESIKGGDQNQCRLVAEAANYLHGCCR